LYQIILSLLCESITSHGSHVIPNYSVDVGRELSSHDADRMACSQFFLKYLFHLSRWLLYTICFEFFPVLFDGG